MWCGSDGSHALLSGAALSRDVTLVTDSTLARVGLWIALPESVRALRVYVTGDAVESALVAPTALRLRSVERASAEAPWRGAALSGVTIDGARALVAEVRVDALSKAGRARVAVLELAGLTRGEGEGSVTLRAVLDAGGCLTQTIALRVSPTPEERTVAGAYVAFEASFVEQAARVARWVDAVVGAMVGAGALSGVATVRASGAHGADVEGAALVSERGVEGDVWRGALRAMASGRASWVELWDPRDPEAAGLSVALGTRARPSPCEMSAWAETDASVDEAWWSAAEPERVDTLQAIVGRWREPVTPRVITAWERGRGVRGFAAEAPWLSRYVRAPGERGRIRGGLHEREGLRACWPSGERDVREVLT